LAFQNDDTVEITIATNAGACFGVVRAVKLAHQAVARAKHRGGSLYSFGPLIHNPHVVANLAQNGVRTIHSAEEAVSGTVVLRSHGVQLEAEKKLKQRGISVVDATCPLVKKPQRIAKAMADKGYFLVVVGDSNHPEVKGVISYFGRPDYRVMYDPEVLLELPAGVQRVAVLAQTTIEVAVFDAVVARARALFSDVVAYNTICDATSIRQSEAERLARGSDVVVVVGGKNSSNTSKLVKICRDFQSETYHIEHWAEVRRSWFTGKRKIGVTAGASTPHEYVDEVGAHIARLIQANE
jgi:4-hydroxy-3-methylbut-2-enyl diphosphate reductase